MFSKPGILLRVEGAFAFALSLFFYRSTGARWWVFLALFLWPDLFMLGYLVSARFGGGPYNFAHAYILPLAVQADYGCKYPRINPDIAVYSSAFDGAIVIGGFRR